MNESPDPHAPFSRRLDEIDGIVCSPCRAVLLARFLDTLAETLYPDLAKRQKSTRLLETSAAWPDKTRVSIPQLKLHLEAMFSAEERSRSRLYKSVILKQPEGGLGRAPEHEPFYYEWEEWARADEIPALLLTRWLSLLSAFCHLAAANPERAHETASRKDSTHPHYQSHGEVFALAFPAGFLKLLTRSCLENVFAKKNFKAEDRGRLSAMAERFSPEDLRKTGHKN